MKTQKALFFDVDGTLYDSSTHQIRSSTIQILEELSKDPQIDLFLSTGRSWLTIEPLGEILNYFKGFNLSNGQYILIDKEVIVNKHIAQQTLQKLYHYCEIKQYSLGMISETAMYIIFLMM